MENFNIEINEVNGKVESKSYLYEGGKEEAIMFKYNRKGNPSVLSYSRNDHKGDTSCMTAACKYSKDGELSRVSFASGSSDITYNVSLKSDKNIITLTGNEENLTSQNTSSDIDDIKKLVAMAELPETERLMGIFNDVYDFHFPITLFDQLFTENG